MDMCYVYISRFQQTTEHKYRTEHAAGLHLLSTALMEHCGVCIPEEELPDAIRTGAYGKPELISYPNIHFNISHCSDMAVCALSRHEIGVDIEKITFFRDTIIKKVLTAREQDFLRQMSTDEHSHQEWFFRFWTLKESRIKHSGMGLSMPLNSFSFQYNPNTSPYEITCSENNLYFHQQMLDGQYILSVCSSDPKAAPKIIYL